MGRKILRMQRFLHEARVHAYWYMHRRNINIVVRWEHAEKSNCSVQTLWLRKEQDQRSLGSHKPLCDSPVIHLEDIVVQDKLTQILVAYFL
jgi:hypothetical protein